MDRAVKDWPLRLVGGCDQAWTLVCQYEPVARKVAAAQYEHCRGTVDLEDLQQAALIGLHKAARRWEPSKGAFPSFARSWAFWECRELVKQSAHECELPERFDERVGAHPVEGFPLRDGWDLPPTLATAVDVWADGGSDAEEPLAFFLHPRNPPTTAATTADPCLQATFCALCLHVGASPRRPPRGARAAPTVEGGGLPSCPL